MTYEISNRTHRHRFLEGDSLADGEQCDKRVSRIHDSALWMTRLKATFTCWFIHLNTVRKSRKKQFREKKIHLMIIKSLGIWLKNSTTWNLLEAVNQTESLFLHCSATFAIVRWTIESHLLVFIFVSYCQVVFGNSPLLRKNSVHYTIN